MWRVEALSERDALNEENKHTKDMLERLRESVRKLETEYEKSRQEAKALERECRAIRFTEEEEQFVPPLEEISEEELDRQIQLDEARLGLLHTDNPNAVREFEERGKLIDSLKTKLERLKTNVTTTQDVINEVKSRWEPQLDSLVQQISDAFADNFNRMGCAGQVTIHKDEDFDKWSLQIQVKFR
jgi:structural maintenance of chromosomes protein 5